MPENENAELVQTQAPTEEEVVNTPQQEATPQEQPQEKTYTKDDVTKYIIQKGERMKKALCKRFGVESLDDLEEMQKNHVSREEELSRINLENADLKREIAFLKNNIDPERYNDVKAHFKGNDIDLTEESLIEALKSHPEWLKKSANVSTITAVGREHSTETADDRRDVMNLFGLKN